MIIIIIDVILAIFAVSSLFGIKESQMEIISNDTVHNGDSINIKLSDIDGHSLSNESVKIVNEKFNSSNAVKLIKVREGSSNKNSTNVTGVDAQKSPSQ